jgi:transcriptional regulator with XRE-family HTH domain
VKIQERIRRARRRAGLSQAGLAERVDVRRSAVSNWESANETLPSMQNLLSIAKACGVSLEWLGTGRGGISLASDALAEIPAADAELVDVEEERILLAGFRNLPRRSQQLVLDLVETLQAGRRRAGKV